jgi:hypothetical protein
LHLRTAETDNTAYAKGSATAVDSKIAADEFQLTDRSHPRNIVWVRTEIARIEIY